MSLRRLNVLVSRLPRDSATTRAVNGAAADWGVAEHLLARIANLVHQTGSAKKVPASQLVKPPGQRKQRAFDIGER